MITAVNIQWLQYETLLQISIIYNFIIYFKIFIISVTSSETIGRRICTS